MYNETQDIFSGADLITPADANLAKGARAFRSPAAGVIKVTTADGQVLVHPVAQGEVVKLMVNKIWATGTTAGIVSAGVVVYY
jgi:hypothetical protein